MKKVLIFASGSGSNFEAIIKYFFHKKDVEFELLCDIQDAKVLQRAQKFGITSHFVPYEMTYDFLKSKKYDLYVLAGYMRILPEYVLNFGTFVNIHPSLLPDYKGKNAILRQYNDNVQTSGVSVHYVTKDVDCGEIIKQASFRVLSGTSFSEFENCIHKIEHKIYPKVIEELLR